jgi:hypothetical protein
MPIGLYRRTAGIVTELKRFKLQQERENEQCLERSVTQESARNRNLCAGWGGDAAGTGRRKCIRRAELNERGDHPYVVRGVGKEGFGHANICPRCWRYTGLFPLVRNSMRRGVTGSWVRKRQDRSHQQQRALR